MHRRFSAAIVLVFVFSIGALSCGKDTSDAPPLPKLVADETELNFGAVNQGVVVAAQTTLRNIGEAPLVVGPFQVSCPCTTARVDRTYLAPGETATLFLTFETKGFPGADRQYVSVFTDDLRLSPVVIALDGVVTPELIVEPELHRIPYSKEKRIPYELRSLVSNARETPLALTAVHSNGPGVRARLEGNADLPYTIPGLGRIAVLISVTGGTAEEPLSGSVDLEFDRPGMTSARIVLMQDTEPVIQLYRKALPDETPVPTPESAAEAGG
jgi:hypothetical protein